MRTPKTNNTNGTTSSADQKPRLAGVEQDRGADGPEHVAGAVREVHDAEHAEDDGQAEGGERVEPARRQALHRVLDEALMHSLGDVDVRTSLQEPSGACRRPRRPGPSW